MASIQFEYDPDDLATKTITQMVHKSHIKTCVVIFFGQIVFSLNTAPDEIGESEVDASPCEHWILEIR